MFIQQILPMIFALFYRFVEKQHGNVVQDPADTAFTKAPLLAILSEGVHQYLFFARKSTQTANSQSSPIRGARAS